MRRMVIDHAVRRFVFRRLEIVSGDKAGDGSFVKALADTEAVPVELAIGGTWEGSRVFWDMWVAQRVQPPAS